MAKSLIVRAITTLPDGSKEVSFSFGGATPPAGTTGSYTFGSDDELKAFIQQFEESMDEAHTLALHLAATYLAADGTFRNTNQVIGKTLTVDVFGQSPVKVV